MVSDQSHSFFQSLLAISHCTSVTQFTHREQSSGLSTWLPVINPHVVLQKWIIEGGNCPTKIKVQYIHFLLLLQQIATNSVA